MTMTNENHALTKAESCYHCKPLVQQRDELIAQVQRLRNLLESAIRGEEIIVGDSIVIVLDAELVDEIEEALDESPNAAPDVLKATGEQQ